MDDLVVRNVRDPHQLAASLREITRCLMCLCTQDLSGDSSMGPRRQKDEWCRKRQKSIDEIEQLAADLETWEKTTSYTKYGAAAFGLASGIVSVTGRVLNYFNVMDRGVTEAMITYGQIGGVGAGVVGVGAAALEHVREHYDVKAGQRVLQDDEEETAKFLTRLIPTAEFRQAVEEIMDFNVFARVIDGFRDVAREVQARNAQNQNQMQVCLPPDVIRVLELLRLPKGPQAKLQEIITVIYRSQECWNLVNILADKNKEHPLVFQAACLLSKSPFFEILGAQSITALAATVGLSAAGAAQSAVLGGITAAIKLLFDIANVKATRTEINDMEPSEIIKRLRKVANVMRDEMNDVEDVYQKLYEPNI